MGSDCIFCKIAKGEIPCHKIYEDKEFFAFLDITPINKGHTLLIPKEHFKDIFDAPEELISKITLIIKKIMVALDKAGFGEGYTLVQRNREAGGQDVLHIHYHIIPRIKGDKKIIFNLIKKPSEEEMQKIANKIKNSL